MNRTTYFVSILSLALIFFTCVPQLAFAGSEDNVSGWAWSTNIGWISFNSTNCPDTGGNNPCTGTNETSSDYGVNQDSVTNKLNGYAWSSNIGWILFGCDPSNQSRCLSGFPSTSVAPGTQSISATVQGTKLVGWARACAGTSVGTCASMTSRTDGWDGWISLSGTAADNTSYGVTYTPVSHGTGGNFSGYAWGGPVVGWISFNPYVDNSATPGVGGCNGSNNCSMTTTATPPPAGFTLDCNGQTTPISITPTSPAVTLSVNPSNFNGSGTLTISPLSPAPTGSTVTYSFDGYDYYPSPTEGFSCGSDSCYMYGNSALSMQFSPALARNQSYSGSMSVIATDNSPSDDISPATCTINVTATPNNNSQNGTSTTYKEF